MPGDSIVFQDRSQEPNYYSEFVTTPYISVYATQYGNHQKGIFLKGTY